MLQPGDTFGDYRVVRLLGKGGMGSVFLLENAEGAQVAAKILDPESSHDEESRKRFLREAQLALGVKHPNLVETYDVGEDPETGLCYILMEYVPGGSLADRLKTGPLSVNDAIRITYQIAAVLELARQKGIVHRDIKPDNIMFGADGKAKLADLGIARGGVGGVGVTTVTQTGMMIGTPAYMAPEQMLDAHHVDTRADIYSLGIVFYEMLVGKRPNADDTVVQLMARAVAGEPIPDVRTMRPEVSAAVAELVGLMCAMKADERVQTPADVTTALSQIVHGREVTIRRKAPSAKAVRRTSAGSRMRIPVARIFLLLAFAGLAGLGYWGFRGKAQPGRTEADVQPDPVTKVIVREEVKVRTVTNTVEQAVVREEVKARTVTNTVEKSTGRMDVALEDAVPILAPQAAADVRDPSVQMVIDGSRDLSHLILAFTGSAPIYGVGLSVPVNVRPTYFTPISKLDLSRANVAVFGRDLGDADNARAIEGFVRGGGTFVTFDFFLQWEHEDFTRRFGVRKNQLGARRYDFEGFPGEVPDAWQAVPFKGRSDDDVVWTRRMGGGRIVLLRQDVFWQPFAKGGDSDFRDFWNRLLTESATEYKRISVRTPMPAEDVRGNADRTFDCCGFTFYEDYAFYGDEWNQRRGNRSYDIKIALETFLPILARIRGTDLSGNGVKNVYLSGGVVDVVALNGPRGGFSDEVFLLGNSCGRFGVRASMLEMVGTLLPGKREERQYFHMSRMPLDQYASALAVMEYARAPAAPLCPPRNDFEKRETWNIPARIASAGTAPNGRLSYLDERLTYLGRMYGVFEDLRKERPNFVAEYFRKLKETGRENPDASVQCAVLSAVFGRDLSAQLRKAGLRMDAVAAQSLYLKLKGGGADMAPPKRKERMSFMLPGKVEMQLEACPAGTFLMGYADSDWPAHAPHEVKISRPFWIGKYPVTVEQWMALCGTRALTPDEELSGGKSAAVGNITYWEAMDFCERLTRKCRRHLPKGYVFRLPTEAEWEYACKANSSDPDDPYVRAGFKSKDQETSVAVKASQKRAELGARGVMDPGAYNLRVSWRVGTKQPNAWGVHDMIGINGEYVLDTFSPRLPNGDARKMPTHARIRGSDPETTDPLFQYGKKDAVGLVCGSFQDDRYGTGAMRKWAELNVRYGILGFRVVAAPDLIRERKNRRR